MARQTFGQALDAANELDAKYGGNSYADEVLCRMLGHVGVKNQAKPAPVRLLVKSLTATPSKAAKSAEKAVTVAKPKAWPAVGNWSRSEVELALNDGVVRGKISGTAATAAMKAFDRKR